jgi:hypothetical protein
MRDGLFYFSERGFTNTSTRLSIAAASRDEVQADFSEALLSLTEGASSVSSDAIRQAHT